MRDGEDKVRAPAMEAATRVKVKDAFEAAPS